MVLRGGIERANLRREDLIGAEGRAHQHDRGLGTTGAERQDQVPRVEPALSAPRKAALAVKRCRFAVGAAQQLAEEIEIVALREIGEALARRIKAQALGERGSDQTKAHDVSVLGELA